MAKQPTKATTLRDVARATGFSIMTVSRALNGSGPGLVAASTRAQIEDAARRLGYRPNVLATALLHRRSGSIGLVGNKALNADSPWSGSILAGLQRGCAENGLDLLLHGYQGRAAVGPDQGLRELVNGKVDGLLVFAFEDDPVLTLLRDCHLALVAIVEPVPGLPAVLVDEDAGMRLLVRHLHQRGHRRVVLRRVISEREAAAQRLRVAAAEAEAQALGMALTVLPCSYAEAATLTPAEVALVDPARPDRCTALLGCADHQVHPVLDDCRRRGWRVPEDLAVAGFDGIEPFMPPPAWLRLTTVRAPWPDLASTAVGLLARAIAGERVPQRTVLPVELVIGETS